MQLLPEAGDTLKYSFIPKPIRAETRPLSHCAIYGWRPNERAGDCAGETTAPPEAQAAAKLGYI